LAVLGAYVMLCEGEVWYAGELSGHSHAAAWNGVQCVGSQAGVLCEMTTRADETDRRRRRPSPRRDVNQAMVGSAQSSQPLQLDDTATLQDTPRGLLSISPRISIVHESWHFCILVTRASVYLYYRSIIHLDSQSSHCTATTLQQACSMRTETLVQCLERACDS